MLLYPDSIGNGKRLFFCENSCPGIALLYRIIPVLMIARQLQGDLSFLQLALLDTENIRVRFLKKFHKALAHTGSQAIYIP